MAIRQILSKRHRVTNALGAPLAAGEVNVYEPGTNTPISIYQDSALTVAHANPVILSGSGRAEIWVDEDCDVRIVDTDGNLITEELNSNPLVAGSFTGSFTGLIGEPITGTINWRRFGDFVVMWAESEISATSDQAGLVMSGIPAALRPSATRRLSSEAIDNSISTQVWAELAANGTITFGLFGASSAFTASGTKGIFAGWQIVYPL